MGGIRPGSGMQIRVDPSGSLGKGADWRHWSRGVQMSYKERTRQGKVKRVVLGGRRAEYMGKGEMEGRNWGIGDPR